MSTLQVNTIQNTDGQEVYTAKAWVNFSGQTTVIRGGGNVSSITDNGIGDYTVNFTNPMNSVTYSAVGSSVWSSVSGGYFLGIDNSSARTTTTVRVKSLKDDGTLTDTTDISVIVIE